MGILIDGRNYEAPQGLVVKNFTESPSITHFKNQARPAPKVTEVVVHETVTRSWADTVAVLKQRGLGVHFIADHDGTIYQHADLLTDEMWHASQHNPMSVGIETVNPYEPGLAPKDGPWTNTLDAPWAAGGKYLVPTAAQAEAVCQLVNWLTSADANPITIPQAWPGIITTPTTLSTGEIVSQHEMYLQRVEDTLKPPNPGVLAHMYFGHSDGAWLVLYAWLRLEAKLAAADAYTKAMELAKGSRGKIDISSYFSDNPFLTA